MAFKGKCDASPAARLLRGQSESSANDALEAAFAVRQTVLPFAILVAEQSEETILYKPASLKDLQIHHFSGETWL